MKIRNISLRVVSLLVLTFVFVVATAVFTVFDIRTQTENMETSLAEEARTFAREMDAVWEFMDNSQYTINNTTTGVYEFKGLHCAIVGKSVSAIFSAGNNYSSATRTSSRAGLRTSPMPSKPRRWPCSTSKRTLRSSSAL
ncbi:MAG: hypothetical protein ACLSGS_12170 [Adlercreutzia sp.]